MNTIMLEKIWIIFISIIIAVIIYYVSKIYKNDLASNKEIKSKKFYERGTIIETINNFNKCNFCIYTKCNNTECFELSIKKLDEYLNKK